jgi:hypothetical protein
MPQAESNRAEIGEAIAAGLAQADMSAVATYLRQRSG